MAEITGRAGLMDPAPFTPRPGWFRRSLAYAVPFGALLVALAYVTLGHIYAYTTPEFDFALDVNARVDNVEEGTEAAGKIKKGDRLMAMRLLPSGSWIRLRSSFQYLVWKRKLRKGDLVELRFRSKKAEKTIILRARRPSIWPSMALSVGSFVVVFALCIILWIRRHGEPGLEWLVVVILNVYLVLYGFTHVAHLLPSRPLFLIYLVFDLFTVPLLLHLLFVFPEQVAWVKRRPWLPVLLYLPEVGIVTVSAIFYLQLFKHQTEAFQTQMLLLGSWWMPLTFLAYLLAAVAVMIWRFVTATPEMRARIQWILYGGGLATVLTAIFSIVQWRTSPVSWLLESSEYLLPVYAIVAITVGFSYLSFRLIDVHRIVHRSLVYGLVTGAVAVIYLVLAGGLGFVLTMVVGTQSTLSTVLATVVAAALFFPLRRAVQANVDRLFFRHRTVFPEILQQASSEFVTILDLDRLSKVLLEMLVTKLARRHALLLLVGQDRRLEKVRTAGREPSLGAVLPSVDSFALRKLRAHASGETVASERLAQDVQPPRLAREFGNIFAALDASLIVFLQDRDQIQGLLVLGPKTDGTITTRDEISTMESLGRQLSVAVRNARAYTEIERLSRDLSSQQEEILALKNRLEAENIYLREEIQHAARHGEIVGQSEPMMRVLELTTKVARTNTTALIRGESGTGKELIARAIHEASERRDASLVTINCAAIPEGLLESELFGHVKGAFTGAVAHKRGRFELAEGGTLFFDEVGDMPLALQAKLLRALQEREIVPVGGEHPTKVDVRVIAATNRDLDQQVADGLFREDLFYRLNVVPVELPPLRHRREDIPILAEYFMALFAQRSGKEIVGISRAAMDRLMAYRWPGNVRELANVIERAVVLSGTSILDEEVTLPTSGLEMAIALTPPPRPVGELQPYQEAVNDFKRRLLEEAIRRADGNRAKAARQLGLQRTYLYRLVRQLNVQS